MSIIDFGYALRSLYALHVVAIGRGRKMSGCALVGVYYSSYVCPHGGWGRTDEFREHRTASTSHGVTGSLRVIFRVLRCASERLGNDTVRCQPFRGLKEGRGNPKGMRK